MSLDGIDRNKPTSESLAKELEAKLLSNESYFESLENSMGSDGVRDMNRFLPHALAQLPEDILRLRSGHGASRGCSDFDDIKTLLNIADGEDVQGDWGWLRGSCYMDAWDSGSMMFVSRKVSEEEKKKYKNVNCGPCSRKDIEAIFLNGRLSSIADELKVAVEERWPEVKVLSFTEVKDFLNPESENMFEGLVKQLRLKFDNLAGLFR